MNEKITISRSAYEAMQREITELPSVSLLYIEHRSHEKICPLCHLENKGEFSECLQAPVQYVAQVEAMAGYLSVYTVYESIKERILQSYWKKNWKN